MDVKEVTFLISGCEIQPQITIPASETILQLKKQIAEKTQVPVCRQNLFYENKRLVNSTPIKQYNFRTFAELNLTIDMYPDENIIEISITSLGFIMGLRMSKIQKVIQLKEKLAELLLLETKDITLWHMDTEMLDDKCLYKYFVTEGSDILFTRTESESESDN